MDSLLNFIDNADPSSIGLGTLVTMMIISILRGWVVPRSVHIDRIADKDTQLASLLKEKDSWRDSSLKKDEVIVELTSQVHDLIDGADTTNRLMESLRNQIERNGFPSQRQIESGK